MAAIDKRQIKVLTIDGDWTGPIQREKYTNWEAPGTVDAGKGAASAMLQVGSLYAVEHLQAGSTYEGSFIYQRKEDKRWVVSFLCKDNPSLQKPQAGQGGGSSGGMGDNELGQRAGHSVSNALRFLMPTLGETIDEDKVVETALTIARITERVKAALAAQGMPESKTEDEEDNLPF